MTLNAKDYAERLRLFEEKLERLRKMQPQEDYLHQVMDGIPFRDLEVELDMAAEMWELRR